MKVINGEGAYRATTGGVGAVVGDDNIDVNPLNAFKESYSIARHIIGDRLADDERKRAAIKSTIGDIDFSTNGIRANDAPYFQGGKNLIKDFYANAISSGVNPNDPKFIRDNLQAQNIKKSYSVMVDASIDLNKRLKEAYDNLYKNPGKWDVEKSAAQIKKFSNAPITEAINRGNEPLLVPKQWNLEEWAAGVFDEKKGKFTPEEKVITNKKGQVVESSGFGEWDPNMKSFPKTQEVASWELRNNPEFRDHVIDTYGALPPSVQKEYQSIAQTATQNGNPISAEDYYAYTLLEPFAWTKSKYKGETADVKEGAKIRAGTAQIKKTFQSDIDRLLLLSRGDNSIFQQRDGKKLSQYFVGKTVGTYADATGKEVPAKVVSIEHLGKTPEGRPIIRYKTTGTENAAGTGLVDEDGFVTTNDPNDIIYPMINSEYGKDAQQYIKAYQDRVKELGAWKGGTIDPYTPDIDKLSPGYKLEDVQSQVNAIDELNPANYLNIDYNKAVKGVAKNDSVLKKTNKYPWQK